jgi:1,4-dihydroxy-2-naphthoyl-CoA hydrolase
MAIWKKTLSLEDLRQRAANTLSKHLGIEFTELGEDYLTGTMPVDHRTHQVHGILHGGASVAFAETLGSVAGNLAVGENARCVGLEINANHVGGIASGLVIGTARAIHLGRSTQVWDIRIEDENQRLICVSRLTLAVLSEPVP